MDHEFDLICFRVDGALRQLYSSEECREAVARGDVNVNTLIDVYWSDGRIERLAAGIIKPFAMAFEQNFLDSKLPEAEGTAQPIENAANVDSIIESASLPDSEFVPATGERLNAAEHEADSGTPDALIAVRKGKPSQPRTNIIIATETPSKSSSVPELVSDDVTAIPELTAQATPPVTDAANVEPLQRTAKNSATPWLLFVAFITFILILFGNAGDEVTDAPRTQIESNQPAVPAVDPLAALPEQSFYTARPVRLRVGPSSQSEARDNMYPRDTLVKGKIVPSTGDPTQRWLLLTQGIDSGLYIWATNLSKTKMPALDTSVSGEWYATDALQIRAGPTESSPVITIDETGTPLTLKLSQTYTVSGLVDENWAEIELANGGVGYVPITALNANSSEDSLADAGNAAADATAEAVDEAIQGRKMLIRRTCATDYLQVLVRYESASGIRFGQAKIRGRADRYIESDIAGTPARTISAVIWYVPIEANGIPSDMSGVKGITTNKFLFNGRLTLFVKANLSERGSEEYLIPFDCE